LNTKSLAATIVFAALTVALNPAISGIGIPAFYAPYLIYGLWEIPIVVAFLLISPLVGILISLLNASVLFALFPGALPAGPFYNLIAIFSMFIGLFIGRKFFGSKLANSQNVVKIVTASTALGMILRVAVMALVNYITLQMSYPFGFELNGLAVLTVSVPETSLFNATVVLYTIPIGEFITNIVKSRLSFRS
jgi:riboflavin transporter FmnP